MNKALVIGGSGFMGSHLADELSNRGYSVTVFDLESSPWLKKEQKFIGGSILDVAALEAAIRGSSVVYHFAGVADIEASSRNPKQTLETNIMGTVNVLELCVKYAVKRFVFASSVYVYSDRGSFYRVSKQACESIIEAYKDRYGLNYTILRYGSLYGDRAQDWNGLRKYIKQALREGKIEYSGTGQEKREYIHALDAARLSVDALDDRYVGQSLTLTGQEVLDSAQLMRLIQEILGKKIVVQLKSLPENNNHYEMTPYRYSAKPGTKIVCSQFVDLGQGILSMIEEISQELGRLDKN